MITTPKSQGFDIAAYFWPAYQRNDRIWNRFFVNGNEGEWEINRASRPKFEGHRQPRVPLWGYLDGADPAVMERHINAATTYGVNVFIFDWYWYDGQPFLENCIHNGFLKAEGNHRIKFYLMWANHNATTLWDIRRSHNNDVIWPGAVDLPTFKTIVDHVISRYFSHPSYYKIDGKPVFSIYEISTLIAGLGGLTQAREALEYFKEKTVEAGFPGLHVQGILWARFPEAVSMIPGDNTPTQDGTVKALGINSLTNYQFVHLAAPQDDYVQWGENATKDWDRWSREFSVPFFPHVSVDWDTNPRFIRYTPCIKTGVGPANFIRFLRKAKAYANAHPDQPKLITINSWNEWSEGSYLEPDTEFGYGYLEAIREVFGGGNAETEGTPGAGPSASEDRRKLEVASITSPAPGA